MAHSTAKALSLVERRSCSRRWRRRNRSSLGECPHYIAKYWNCLRLMNEWMMHLYSALLCIAVHTKGFTIMWGGGLSSTTTSVQHPLWWCDGCHRTTAPVCSPHTSYRWRGERVIEPIMWMGIIRRPWLTRASGGNLARTLGSLWEVPWDF